MILFSPPADDVGITMFGMFVVLARGVAFIIVKHVEIDEHLTKTVLLYEVDKLATIFLGSERVWLDHLSIHLIVFQFGVKVIAR